MTDKMICLVDTNILVYAFDTTDKKKHEKAKVLLEKCWSKKATYAITAQNLAEFFIIVTQKIENPIAPWEAQQIIADIQSFSQWKVLTYGPLTVLRAIELCKKGSKHFWDALIMATMLENGIFEVYTENVVDFAAVKNISPVNPLI